MHPAYRQARFLMSVVSPKDLPGPAGPEVAFGGRSNTGKSSAINALLGIKALARVSRTPGRTQAVNLIALGEERRLADLPGYGYAKAPAGAQARWAATVEAYLRNRATLRGVILIMDVRHPLTDYDRQMLDFCGSLGLRLHVLLTKADKLGRGRATDALRKVRAALDEEWPGATAQLFSAVSGTGLDEARGVIDTWLGLRAEPSTGKTKKSPG